MRRASTRSSIELSGWSYSVRFPVKPSRSPSTTRQASGPLCESVAHLGRHLCAEPVELPERGLAIDLPERGRDRQGELVERRSLAVPPAPGSRRPTWRIVTEARKPTCYPQPMPIGAWEIALIVVVILLLFGSTKLPKIARSMGRGAREFKETVTDQAVELKEATVDVPKQFKDGMNPLKPNEQDEDEPAPAQAQDPAPVPAGAADKPAEPKP